MRPSFLLLVFIFFVGGAVWLSWQRLAPRESDSPSGLVIVPQEHDLGQVKYGEVPTADFEVRNQGRKEITITRISTSCGCTTATVIGQEEATASGKPIQLETGESLVMRVAFNPAIHGDDTDLGQVKRVIYVTTDNPDQPEVQATIEAEVYK
jgi:hypothetical protein